MNKHWLVLSVIGRHRYWRSFNSEKAATANHCANIEHKQMSYLVEGSTKDAYYYVGVFHEELIQDS